MTTKVHGGRFEVEPANKSLSFEDIVGSVSSGLPLDLVRLRAAYVRANGWLPKDEEGKDRYDNNPQTHHIVGRSGENEILATARFTPVDSIEDSMSFEEMLKGNPDMQKAVLLHSATLDSSQTQTWDLTRLIARFYPHDEKRRMLANQAMFELFGRAVAITGAKSEYRDDVQWVFATTPAMKLTLRQGGIQMKVLASGRASETDLEDTHFCRVMPAEAFQYLADNRDKYPEPYDNVAQGIRDQAWSTL